MLLLSSADFFSILTFSKNSFRHTIRVSNGSDPDQDRHIVGPDLGPNCLQRLSADDKSPVAKKELIKFWYLWYNSAGKTKNSLCKCKVSPNPWLLEHTEYSTELAEAILKKLFVCCHATVSLKIATHQK